MKKTYSIIIILLAFFGGVTVTSIIARTEIQENFHGSSYEVLEEQNNNSEVLIAIEKTTDNGPLDIAVNNEERISVVEHKLDNILSAVMDINKQLETIDLVGHQNTQFDHIAADQNLATDKGAVDMHINDALSDDEENAIKDNVISSLSYPETTLQTISNSKEVRSLSTAMQKEVFTEIAKQLDSGVIDKERFLPGFKQKEPSE